jgi:VIT1/CCC1 family predicted Fe2+/Mn2+ transporter
MSEEEEEEEGGGEGTGEVAPPLGPGLGGGLPSDNPLGDALDVTVSIPETLEIRMVDATVLSDYEVWQFISSLIGAAVVGFGVAFFQEVDDMTLLAVTLMFLLLFAIAVRMAYAKRQRLTKKSRSIRLRATGGDPRK